MPLPPRGNLILRKLGSWTLRRNRRKGGRAVKATTVAGLMAGSALGIAVGAGLMMMPQTRSVRKAIEKGVCDLSRSAARWIR